MSGMDPRETTYWMSPLEDLREHAGLGDRPPGPGRDPRLTPKGTVLADKVVLATDARGTFFRSPRSKQVPVWTHIVMTEPLKPEHFEEIGWQTRQGIEDARNLATTTA